MASRICSGCRRPFEASILRRGRCRDCSKGTQNRRSSPNDALRRKVYDSSRWRNYTRPVVIARDLSTCRSCGRIAEPPLVDHIIPIEQLVVLNRNPWNPDECQTLCRTCSGKKDGGRAQ